MSTDREYNGWANYETWVVNLWLSNDEATWNYWTCEAVTLARLAIKENPSEYLTAEEHLKHTLEVMLKENLEEQAADLTTCTLLADLLGAAICEVDLGSVVDSFLEAREECEVTA